MALLEDTLGGWGGGILVGVGALAVVPSVVSIVGPVLRPVARTVVWGGLAIMDGVSGVVAAAYEQVTDLVAEARAEAAGSGAGSGAQRRAPVHR